MPERFKVVCMMQGAIQVLSFTFFTFTTILSFLLVTFLDSIKQTTADIAEPILTRYSSYDVSS